jgi:phosphatidylserine/phosphatidylglycerophosphate/cardiolipin synthase-like enzyme
MRQLRFNATSEYLLVNMSPLVDYNGVEDKNFQTRAALAAPPARGGRTPQSMAARRGTARRSLDRRRRRRDAEGPGVFRTEDMSMRATSSPNTVLKVRAIGGLHVVVLAWDFRAQLNVGAGELPAELKNLQGFAIERTELDSNGNTVENYMLRGIKRYRHKDEGMAAGTPVPLDEHPVQTFQWADYTPKPGTHYKYTVTPLDGTPKNLQPRLAAASSVDITTEAEEGAVGVSGIRHDVYFNRGVIGSQHYARKFENAVPDTTNPQSQEMKWLSRGLFEGLLKFIAQAKDEHFALRCAFYEFHYLPVAHALRAAVEAGADVKIIYDAESSYKVENITTLQAADLFHNDIQKPRTVTEGIRHNKFIVLLQDTRPIAVWTGSTNISAGGIFGHSNAGHAVWDGSTAKAYLDYWTRLGENLTPTKLRVPNRTTTPTPVGKTPKNTVVPLFSARDDKDSVETLQWYADRMNDATRIMCFTVAFNLDLLFQNVIKQENDVLRYIVKDDLLENGETVGQDHDVLFAGGAYLGEGAVANFLKERDNPLNTNDYIHTKYMLVDPLGDDPLVVTGSANFSRPSQRINDENMLVIRGDKRVADIYFGEFMRLFDHHYARYIVRKLTQEGTHDLNAGYLKEEAKDWVRPHFNQNSYKNKRRLYFTEG